MATQDTGTVAELVAAHKTAKYVYSMLKSCYIFQPIAVESVLLRWQDFKTQSVSMVLWHKHHGGGVNGGVNP